MAESRAAFTERGSTKTCAFCAIVAGDASANEVFRSDDFVAFLDAHPVFAGHVLMVPTRHVQTYDELPIDLADAWVRTSQALERAVESAMDADGSLLIVNNVVSQSVPHLHLHVIPRSRGDGLRFWLGPRHAYASPDEADAVASRIRVALASAAG
ncbi:HIT family protein [Planctomonas sp. JC2975]|uniref:HIT family protein n=1 Tax=Planctomonas sp. JC2975 TaxID=2729626 RepID=UPI00147460C1|nr:HIT family protein [Planctomonas sp. JC2975]NNC13577.1 HIT family protein [Planctomonas sp. JC2975]